MNDKTMEAARAFYRKTVGDEADDWTTQEWMAAFAAAHCADLEAEVEKLRGALEEIAKCEGAFSRDPLTHAGNVIENAE